MKINSLSGFNPVGFRLLMLVVLASILMLGGCAGKGNTPSPGPSSAQTGRAMLTVQWPERSRLIPFAAESIKVRIIRGESLLGEKLLTRPTDGGTASALFERLPTGAATVQAWAYPNADGSGVPQAQGQVGITINNGQTTDVHLTLASTISRLEITPSDPQTLIVGGTLALSATAKNVADEVVITSTSKIAWHSQNTAIATVDPAGMVTGVAPGSTTIQVTETESKKSASLKITVPPSGDVSVYTNDFEGNIGPEWSAHSVRQDPLHSEDHSLGGFTNTTVRLSLGNLVPHRAITVAFDLYILNSWDGNGPPPIGGEIWSLKVANGGPLLLYTNFNNNAGNQSYPGTYPTDSFPARTGAFFSNEDNPRYTVYRIVKTFDHTASDIQFEFTASGLEEADQNETWAIDDIEVRAKQ